MSAAFSRSAPSSPSQLPPENHPSIHRATPELLDSLPSSPRPPTLPGPSNLRENQS
ncbi:hypothetical protein F2Q68_00035089 [Brassica cretica]|uniref:Uncharacterized protein n=1 Tax=Brassica cretica TaxID=69181 RepID=A0A8S9H3A1_BRACR|nr:hypothetical protein F2Q68_00035089 [Brassica cretica]